MYELLHTIIQEAVSSLGFPDKAFTVEYTTHTSHGDMATNVAMVLAKELKNIY